MKLQEINNINISDKKIFIRCDFNVPKDEFGNIFVKVESDNPEHNKVAIYARVSSNENKINLDSQAERLKQYAIAKGYTIVEVVKEVGSGVNDNRPKLLKLLEKDSYGTIIVEHKDRLTRLDLTI